MTGPKPFDVDLLMEQIVMIVYDVRSEPVRDRVKQEITKHYLSAVEGLYCEDRGYCNDILSLFPDLRGKTRKELVALLHKIADSKHKWFLAAKKQGEDG